MVGPLCDRVALINGGRLTPHPVTALPPNPRYQNQTTTVCPTPDQDIYVGSFSVCVVYLHLVEPVCLFASSVCVSIGYLCVQDG